MIIRKLSKNELDLILHSDKSMKELGLVPSFIKNTEIIETKVEVQKNLKECVIENER